MASYHFSGKVHSRLGDTATNAVRAAAYRAGAVLVDSDGNKYSYTKKNEVEFNIIYAPKGAPEWVYDRNKLWNAVEASEKRVNAQLFREFEGALPHELTLEQNKKLIDDFASKAFVSNGMICDTSFHMLPTNQHVHMSLTMRDITPDGFGKKNRDWNDKALIEKWRKLWGDTCNKHLKMAGSEARIDHRSYKDQGLNIAPEIHEGPKHSVQHASRVARNKNIINDNYINIACSSKKVELEKIEAELKIIESEIRSGQDGKLSLIKSKMLNSLTSVKQSIDNNKAQAIQLEKVSLRPRVFHAANEIESSTCTSLAIYEPPKLIIDNYIIDKALSNDFPNRPIERQRCYTLRQLLGSDADEEYNLRVRMLALTGVKYSWNNFYNDIINYRNKPDGAYSTWWRTYTRMAFNEHNKTMDSILNEAPNKYKKIIISEIYSESGKNRIVRQDYNYDVLNKIMIAAQSTRKNNKNHQVVNTETDNYNYLVGQIKKYSDGNTRNSPEKINSDIPAPSQVISHTEPDTPDVPPQQHEFVAPAYFNPYPDPYAIPEAPRPPWSSSD